ncbi:MAG: DUF2304 domain-containing protein [Lachnospiraceae bacterium]|nr:DUF2304 domain-containing protein [Lachnospiraceae bacterium]MDD7178481.1 DUF2304 domain-containing protein [bacterium]MDY5517407.1 DUF2304 domain-containing protein [Lachnospiraceae bacterium]
MISSSLFFRLIAIAAGVGLLLLTFFMYSKRRLTDRIALGWALFSVVTVMAGAIPAWSGWSRALALSSYPMVFALGGLVVLIIFHHSVYLSLLVMKNQELAMHVSLLNQENEETIKKLFEMEKELRTLKEAQDEKKETAVCH